MYKDHPKKSKKSDQHPDAVVRTTNDGVEYRHPLKES